MGKQILTFGDAGIEKHNFCHYKSPILLENVDIENLLVSSSAGEKSYKYFMMIIKLSHCQTKFLYFLNEDYDLLNKYNTIWD